MKEHAWLFAVRVEDAPGSLMDVVAIFSYRGVSIVSVLGFGRPVCGTGLVLLGIRCSRKRSEELERIVRRLPVVSAVHRIVTPRDGRHRSALVEQLKPSGVRPDKALEQLQLTGSWSLVMGPEPSVRKFLRGGIDRRELGRHVEVLLD